MFIREVVLQYTVAMMGYGPEEKNAVLELTYNYGVTEYDKGNAYAQVCDVYSLHCISTTLPEAEIWTSTHCPHRSRLAPTTSIRLRRWWSCSEGRWCGSQGHCRGSTPRSRPSWTLMAGNRYQPSCSTSDVFVSNNLLGRLNSRYFVSFWPAGVCW